MIVIYKSQNADTRSATKKVSKTELLKQSRQHIGDVRRAIKWMRAKLFVVGKDHDWTKKQYIKEFHDDFALIQSGQVGEFKKMHWFKDFHLLERHHLNDRCPDDVNLFDVLERIADITTAGLARSGKIYDDQLSAEILQKAYKNTIELLKQNIKVVEEVQCPKS